jgi:S1-C subfamily serine protease
MKGIVMRNLTKEAIALVSFIVVALIFILVFLCAYPSKHEELVSSTVKLVLGESSKASAVHVGNGYFLTAAHAIREDVTKLNLVTSSGQNMEAVVLWKAINNDLAVLHVTDDLSNLSFSKLDCSPLTVGDHLKFIGMPGRLDFIQTHGRVAGDYQYDMMPLWKRVIPVDGVIIPGMSGGAVLDERGYLRGINVGTMVGNMGFMSSYTGISYILSGEDICFLLIR